MSKKLVLFFLTAFLFSSCEEQYIPKPRAYFRLDLPSHQYNEYNSDCPFTFSYDQKAKITPSTSSVKEPCWINLNYIPYNAKLHVSYKELTQANLLDQFLEESRALVYKHTIKASNIKEKLIIDKQKKLFGTVYHIEGKAASALQFHLTDSSEHFLRASLYYNFKPNQDSLQPITNYLFDDIDHLIATFAWKSN